MTVFQGLKVLDVADRPMTWGRLALPGIRDLRPACAIAADSARHQRWLGHLAGTNGDIDAFGNKIGACVVEHELEANLWMRREEFRHPIACGA